MKNHKKYKQTLVILNAVYESEEYTRVEYDGYGDWEYTDTRQVLSKDIQTVVQEFLDTDPNVISFTMGKDIAHFIVREEVHEDQNSSSI